CRRKLFMDSKLQEKFMSLWRKYFNGVSFPIAFYYTDEVGSVQTVKPPTGHRCVIADLSGVQSGNSLCFSIDSIGCAGGRRYFGFTHEVMPDFEYFLSCGIPGKLEGERYKKSAELVNEAMKKMPEFTAPARYIVFKRWDMLEEQDDPDVVIFFAQPDVLSGLFTLANFDVADPNGVFAPFSAGCGSIVQYPYLEKASQLPRGVLGMFDVSARPWIPGNVLAFSVPMNKFVRMVEDMEESFLVTPSWDKVRRRIS
ncbi:MAG: DUF169 domain-containing protein, partial [Promethearchaeota archaeon]